jgi:hypothetical protein
LFHIIGRDKRDALSFRQKASRSKGGRITPNLRHSIDWLFTLASGPGRLHRTDAAKAGQIIFRSVRS